MKSSNCDLPGTITKDGKTEKKYYYVQFGGAGDNGNVITKIQAEGSYIQSENGYAVVSGENEASQVSLCATLSTSESTGGEEGDPTKTTRKVVVYCTGGTLNSISYGQNIAENDEVGTDKVTVKICYNSQTSDPSDSVSLTGPTGVTISRMGFDTTGYPNYLLYEVSGLSNLQGDCTLTFDNGTTWPRTMSEGGNEIVPIVEDDPVICSEISTMVGNENLYTLTAESAPTGLILPEAHAPVGKPVILGASSEEETDSAIEVTGLTYTWANLPKTDESGNKLYYYVQEISIGEYSTSYEYEYVDSDPSNGIRDGCGW